MSQTTDILRHLKKGRSVTLWKLWRGSAVSASPRGFGSYGSRVTKSKRGSSARRAGRGFEVRAMSLTDAEISERLAEIEKWWPSTDAWKFNPLYDDALCMTLIKKYRMDVLSCEDSTWQAAVWVDEHEVIEGRDESLNRAVCLAIIKSQGEP